MCAVYIILVCIIHIHIQRDERASVKKKAESMAPTDKPEREYSSSRRRGEEEGISLSFVFLRGGALE